MYASRFLVSVSTCVLSDLLPSSPCPSSSFRRKIRRRSTLCTINPRYSPFEWTLSNSFELHSGYSSKLCTSEIFVLKFIVIISTNVKLKKGTYGREYLVLPIFPLFMYPVCAHMLFTIYIAYIYVVLSSQVLSYSTRDTRVSTSRVRQKSFLPSEWDVIGRTLEMIVWRE